MKKPWGKWFLFVLVLLAVVIGIPVLINESYLIRRTADT